MLKMRLQRTGRKNDASFRVVVTDSRRGPKSGKHIDLLGSYNPKMNQVSINGEKAKDWISKGVQVSDTVHNLLVSEKVIEGKKINVLPKKSPIVDEEALLKAAQEAEKAAAEPLEVEKEAPTDVTADAPAEDVSKEEAQTEAPAETIVEEAETASQEEPKAEEEATKEAPAEEVSEEEKK